jgi:hypothetical protein
LTRPRQIFVGPCEIQLGASSLFPARCDAVQRRSGRRAFCTKRSAWTTVAFFTRLLGEFLPPSPVLSHHLSNTTYPPSASAWQSPRRRGISLHRAWPRRRMRHFNLALTLWRHDVKSKPRRKSREATGRSAPGKDALKVGVGVRRWPHGHGAWRCARMIDGMGISEHRAPRGLSELAIGAPSADVKTAEVSGANALSSSP